MPKTKAPVLPDADPAVGAALLDALPCPWLRVDSGGRLLAWNAEAARLLGAGQAELAGSLLDSWLDMPSRVMMQTLLQPLLKLHGHVAELALTIRPAVGESFAALCYAKREAAEAGASVSIQLVPVVQRRRIEAELLRVKRAADQGTDMIFQLEIQHEPVGEFRWRFPYVSEAVRRLYGCTAEAAAGSAEAVFGRLTIDGRSSVVRQLTCSADAEVPVRLMYPVAAPVAHGGQSAQRWHELRAVPRHVGAGHTVWHGHIADVTERVAWQESLVEREAMERVARARSEFIARVSHELRTPLNGILGFAQLMNADMHAPLPQVQLDRLKIILGSGRHLLAVVNELLEISQIEAGECRLELEPVNVDDAVAEVISVLQPQADAHGISINLHTAGEARLVSAEPRRLRQVLLNLVSNAIKYNRPAGRVSLSCRAAEGADVCIEVVDTGVGLSQAQQAELFQPFNRLGAERGAVEGTGLGLVLSRHLAELMGGRLEVASLLSSGSTFTLTLRGAGHSPEGGSAQPTKPAGDGAVFPAASISGRVLYVEDNTVNSLLMEAMLAFRPGISLDLAADGASACRLAAQSPPSLLLLDMHLPDTTAFDLLPRLRALPGLASVPAAVVSASAGEEIEAQARLAGFDDYWTKPLDLAHTLGRLDHWLAVAAGSKHLRAKPPR